MSRCQQCPHKEHEGQCRGYVGKLTGAAVPRFCAEGKLCICQGPVLPKLKPIPGLPNLGHPLDLLTAEEHQQLAEALEEMARIRRQGYNRCMYIVLGGA